MAVPLEARRLNLQRLIGLIASKSTNDTESLGGQGVLPCDDGGKVPGKMQGKSCDQLWLALSESKRKHHSFSPFNLEPVLFLFEHFHQVVLPKPCLVLSSPRISAARGSRSHSALSSRNSLVLTKRPALPILRRLSEVGLYVRSIKNPLISYSLFPTSIYSKLHDIQMSVVSPDGHHAAEACSWRGCQLEKHRMYALPTEESWSRTRADMLHQRHLGAQLLPNACGQSKVC